MKGKIRNGNIIRDGDILGITECVYIQKRNSRSINLNPIKGYL